MNVGLSDKRGALQLYKSTNENIGWNTFLTTDPNQAPGFTANLDSETCAVVRLDDLHLTNVGFIKIDVEGFEWRVLRGAWETIARSKPYILVEVGWGTRHPEWALCAATYEMLFSLGYQRVDFTDVTQDILFTPVV